MDIICYDNSNNYKMIFVIIKVIIFIWVILNWKINLPGPVLPFNLWSLGCFCLFVFIWIVVDDKRLN